MSRIIAREVEVRSWPETTAVSVIDPSRAIELARFELDKRRDGQEMSALNDPSTPYAERAALALQLLERDQEQLRLHYGAGDEDLVQLDLDEQPRMRLAAVLVDYDLTLDDVAFDRLDELTARLDALSPTQLWELLCDWWDVAERHLPAGTSRARDEGWALNSHPDRACHWQTLAGGDREASYRLFCEAVDLPLEELTLTALFQYRFYLATEFADQTPFALTALQR